MMFPQDLFPNPSSSSSSKYCEHTHPDGAKAIHVAALPCNPQAHVATSICSPIVCSSSFGPSVPNETLPRTRRSSLGRDSGWFFFFAFAVETHKDPVRSDDPGPREKGYLAAGCSADD